MGNVYTLANDNGKLVDVSDMRPDKQQKAGYDCKFIVHRAGNYNEAFDMVGKGMHPHEVATHFCGGCGGYIGAQECCACSCYAPQGVDIEPQVTTIEIERNI